MLQTLTKKKKCNWKDELSKLTYPHNSTRHSLTVFNPFFLMLGRNPRLTIDVLIENNVDEQNKPHFNLNAANTDRKKQTQPER